MDLQVPIIILLLLSNFFWALASYSHGYNEGKREGYMRGRAVNRVSENAR